MEGKRLSTLHHPHFRVLNFSEFSGFLTNSLTLELSMKHNVPIIVVSTMGLKPSPSGETFKVLPPSVGFDKSSFEFPNEVLSFGKDFKEPQTRNIIP